MKPRLAALVLCSLTLVYLAPATSVAEDFKKFAQPVAKGELSSESIYFVMTDRFANGDTSNDNGGLVGAATETGFDPSDWGYWHGGDFKGLTAHLSYIKDMGFTSIWITPPVKNAVLQTSSTGYHGYWALDFLAVDPHLGTAEDFKEFVDQAHKLNIKVILDVVANHTGDVINYANGEPFIPTGKENAKNPGFLNLLWNYHNQGNSNFAGDSLLNGDFYGLDDLATENPVVVKGFIDIWSYWIKSYDIDGLRIDTFKHVNSDFWREVLPAIEKVARDKGKKTFPIFGEVADNSPTALAPYVAGHEVSSVLDFPFALQVGNFVAKGSPASNVVDLFNADDLYTTSTTSAYGLATFLSNHDAGRIGSTIIGDLSENSPLALKRAELANAALLLMRGGPVSYYGDEKGMTGGGGDKSARQDMFATQVSRWQREDRIGGPAIGMQSAFDVINPLQVQIAELNKLVSANPALRNGTQQIRMGDRHFLALTRFSAGQEYVVAFNNDEAAVAGTFAVTNTSGAWSKIAGDCTFSGKKTLTISFTATQYCVLKANTLITKSTASKVTAPKVETSEQAVPWKQVSVKVAGGGYNSVTFLARVKGGQWKSLGTTDHTTLASKLVSGDLYRTYIHPEDFPKVKTVEVIAVVKTSTGKIFTSSITKANIA
jgi:glycosidase